jgi:hypothetical protein
MQGMQDLAGMYELTGVRGSAGKCSSESIILCMKSLYLEEMAVVVAGW